MLYIYTYIYIHAKLTFLGGVGKGKVFQHSEWDIDRRLTIIIQGLESFSKLRNLVWHWNGKRRLILEFRFRWRMHTNLINQTKHRQPYLFKFTWEKKKQTKHSNTTQTNIAVYSCPPALNTFVTLHALSGSSVHANVCPWVPHSARFARLARRSAFEGWAILFKLLIRF